MKRSKAQSIIIAKIRSDLRVLSDPGRATVLQRYFKTGVGEYGEGDIFLGIRVPDLRRLSGKYKDVSLQDVNVLISSKIHEERFLALVFLVFFFSKGTDAVRKDIFTLYCKNTSFINNWDLVDTSAGPIIGAFLENRERGLLYDFAGDSDLWKRRIAVMATFYFIKQNDFSDIMKLAELLFDDQEDLIQKAVGWMLREVGKRDLKTEEQFLHAFYQKMPRTMLRYAIERFPQQKRKKYLKGNITSDM